MDHLACVKLLGDNQTLATVLYAILLKKYPDFHDVDVLELWARIDQDFRVTLSEENENKINGLRLAVETDLFFQDTTTFISIAHALNSGDIADPVEGIMDSATSPELLWAIYEVEFNRESSPILEPQVKAVLDAAIAEESEENPSGQHHAMRYVEEMKAELRKQFAELGADPNLIAQI